MNVEFDEAVISSDHGQPRGGHSEVEPKAEHCVRSKGRSVNGGKRKQIGSGRGSPRARARIALSCAALLGRRRRGESLLRHRMSARVLRMPARGVVADVTRNEPIGRKRREVYRESDMVAFRNGCRGRSTRSAPAGWCGRPEEYRRKRRAGASPEDADALRGGPESPCPALLPGGDR